MNTTTTTTDALHAGDIVRHDGRDRIVRSVARQRPDGTNITRGYRWVEFEDGGMGASAKAEWTVIGR